MGPLRAVLVVSLLLPLVIGGAVRSQELPRWERIGPEGGSICALVAAPSKPAVVYAGGGDAGVFRSLDRGASWSFAGYGLGANAVCSLVVDAVNPSRVWAVTNGKLLRSNDGGSRWLPLDTNAPEISLAAVAHPVRSNLVYLLTGLGVRRSDDGGVTWRTLGGVPAGYASVLIFDPVRPDHMFASIDDGIFRSLDGGRRWKAIHDGLPEDAGHARALAIDSRDGRTLYAGTSAGRLYRSLDLGATWNRLALPPEVGPLALEIAGRSLLVASSDGLWVSRNRGGSFLPEPRLRGHRVADVLSLPSGILASTPYGIYRSPDGGGSFAKSQRGLGARSWLELEIDPAAPDHWYAVDRNENLLRSTNGGVVWRGTARELTADLIFSPTFLTLDPEDSRLYTGLPSLNRGGLLARSADGSDWDALNSFGCLQPHWVLADAAHQRLFVGGYFLIGACGLQPGACALHRSLDDGEHFSCAKDLLPVGLKLLAVHPTSGVLYGSSSTGLARSEDWGETWLPASPLVFDWLQVSPADPEVLWAVDREPEGWIRAFRRSTDEGLSWSEPRGTPPNATLVPDPFDRERLYALTAHQLLVTDNVGASWQVISLAFLEGTLNDLAFDPRTPDTIYAASTGGGLMRLRFAR